MQTQKLTCIIVDDEIVSAEVLAHYVSKIPYLNLKKIFQNSTEALAYLLKTPTDLLITDIMMPQLTGIQLYESIVTQVHTKVIFVSGFEKEMYKALKYSAVDFLQKPVTEKRFQEAALKALKLVQVEYEIYESIPKEVLDKALKNYGTLSATEKKVLGLIAALNTTKQIANELFISLKTAEGHRFNIRKKLGLLSENNLTEIAIFLRERIN
ncbi:MAG: response regulator transcription factor [Arcicella sp.]|nr:response regulator transcription factor [Arcicella sp.]